MAGHPSRPDAPGAVRPRYGRIAAAGGSLLVTFVAALGGLGVLPSGTATAAPQQQRADTALPPTSDQAGAASSTPSTGRARTSGSGAPGAMSLMAEPESAQGDGRADSTVLPAATGHGRRVVFDMSDQRVWLVAPAHGSDHVLRTYLVSGSLTDNLKPGTYSVYSKSLHAVGISDSGTMRYMVRFAHGPNAAIGFHDIPVSHGAPVQTRGELGTPRSHGCIRQARPDAQALWRFAPVGTRVVVLA